MDPGAIDEDRRGADLGADVLAHAGAAGWSGTIQAQHFVRHLLRDSSLRAAHRRAHPILTARALRDRRATPAAVSVQYPVERQECPPHRIPDARLATAV